ncbi:hypothetical protein SDC9_125404 [bioreactor metagenome]|uniref:Uncharacterized protein n=1 Tax=bioreactor metagenome TaxID=1076179 RepID=A0A645CN62_9ZZZZ
MTGVIFYALQSIAEKRIHRLVHLIQRIHLIGSTAAQLCDGLRYLFLLITALFKVGCQQFFSDGHIVAVFQIAKEDITEVINQPVLDLIL